MLTVSGPADVTVVGVATFGDADNRAGNRTVLFSLDTAQRLLGRDGTVDSIAVEATAGVSQPGLAAELRHALGSDLEVVTGTALEKENSSRKNEDVDFFGIFMRVFAAVALLVGAFIINNTFAILVAQRTKELALLRAIGASARQVRRSVAIEAALVGVVASALGLVAGVGVAKGIGVLWRSFGVTMPEGPLVVRPASLVIAFVLGVAVTVGSALLPARRAARVAPVEAMRTVAAESTRTSRRRVVLGLVLVVGSVAAVLGGITSGTVPMVLLGALAGFLGVATLSPVLARPVVRVLGQVLPRLTGARGQLARENAVRNPRRTAATASALMIGVALVGGITVFAASGKWSVSHSFDKEFRGDLVLETGAWVYGGVSPQLAADLAETDEVAAAVPRQFTEAEVGDGMTELAVWPAATVQRVFDLGISAGSLAEMGSDGIALGSRHAESKQLTIGSKVPVTFGNGEQRTFVVRALFDHPDWTGQAWIDRAAYRAVDPAALDTSVYVVGDRGRGGDRPAPVGRRRHRGVRQRAGDGPGRGAPVGGRRLQRDAGHRVRAAGAGDPDRADRHRQHRVAGRRRADPRARPAPRDRDVPRAPARHGALGGGAGRGLRHAARARRSACSSAGRWSSPSGSPASRPRAPSSRSVSWRRSSRRPRRAGSSRPCCRLAGQRGWTCWRRSPAPEPNRCDAGARAPRTVGCGLLRSAPCRHRRYWSVTPSVCNESRSRDFR